MKTIKNLANTNLNAKQKEKIMTIFGTVMIVTLTITSALSFDTRNDNLLEVMNHKIETVKKG